MPINKGEMNATKREPRKEDAVVKEDSENGELLLFSRNFQDTHCSISSCQMHLATLSLKYTVHRFIYYPILAASLQHSILNLSAGEIDSSLAYLMYMQCLVSMINYRYD
jgi:hypothetical protein